MNAASHANPSRNTRPACLAGRRCLDGYASTTLIAGRDLEDERGQAQLFRLSLRHLFEWWKGKGRDFPWGIGLISG